MRERHIYTACPLCAATRFEPVCEGDCTKHAIYDKRLSPTITWVSCASCGHVFTHGYFTDEACEILFSRTHDNQKVGYEIETNRIISARIISRVLPYQKQGRWLDVGFGNGSLLFTAKEFGFHPIGVDLRKENVATMTRLGFEAHCEDIQTLALDEVCQVISLMDVLEHVPHPRPFMEAIVRLLDQGGVCLLSMPNTEQILWDLMTSNNANPYWGEIEHYHNFTRTRLYDFLAEFGLVPKQYGISERYKACMEVVFAKE